MAIQHTDTSIHKLDNFAPSFEDTETKNAQEYNDKKNTYGGLFTFTGDFDLKEASYINYFLMQGDRIKDKKQVSVIKNGDSGISISMEPYFINLAPARDGSIADNASVTIEFFAFQNNKSLEIKAIKMLNVVSASYIEASYNGNKVTLKIHKGFMFSSPQDTTYKVQFTIVAENDASTEVCFVLNKVSKGLSLGRIDYIPSGAILQNVHYDKGALDNEGQIQQEVVPSVYAFTGDLVVNIGNHNSPNKADVYRYNGSDWIIVNDDINACTSAFEDIMACTNGDATVPLIIAKRIIAQQAIINELATKIINIANGGAIQSGCYVNPAAYKKGIQISSNGDVKIKGGTITMSNDADLETTVNGKASQTSLDTTNTEISNIKDGTTTVKNATNATNATNASGGYISQLKTDTKSSDLALATDDFNVTDKSGGFGIFKNGNCYFNNGCFRGTVYADSGEFTGIVHANSGDFNDVKVKGLIKGFKYCDFRIFKNDDNTYKGDWFEKTVKQSFKYNLTEIGYYLSTGYLHVWVPSIPTISSYFNICTILIGSMDTDNNITEFNILGSDTMANFIDISFTKTGVTIYLNFNAVCIDIKSENLCFNGVFAY